MNLWVIQIAYLIYNGVKHCFVVCLIISSCLIKNNSDIIHDLTQLKLQHDFIEKYDENVTLYSFSGRQKCSTQNLPSLLSSMPNAAHIFDSKFKEFLANINKTLIKTILDKHSIYTSIIILYN